MQVSSICSTPHSISFFISSPFFISFSTCLELRGYGKGNSQRARNRGVFRGTEGFPHSIQAGLREHASCSGAWTEGLEEASLSQHVYTFCSRLFSRIAQVTLGRYHYMESITVLPLEKRSCYYGSEDAEVDSFLSWFSETYYPKRKLPSVAASSWLSWEIWK